MKLLTKNEQICVECHQCEVTCAQAYFKTDDLRKSSISVRRERTGAIDLTTCTQCGECIKVCPVQAISRDKNGVVRINKKICVGCFMCVAACPEDAMFYHPEEVEPFKCIACGLCTKGCPTGAIAIQEV